MTQPANGTVVITGGGTGLTYAPDANYCNDPPGTTPDTFTYTLTPAARPRPSRSPSPASTTRPIAVDDAATVAEDAGATRRRRARQRHRRRRRPEDRSPSVTQPANGTVVDHRRRHRADLHAGRRLLQHQPAGTRRTRSPTRSTAAPPRPSRSTVTCAADAPVVDASAGQPGLHGERRGDRDRPRPDASPIPTRARRSPARPCRSPANYAGAQDVLALVGRACPASRANLSGRHADAVGHREPRGVPGRAARRDLRATAPRRRRRSRARRRSPSRTTRRLSGSDTRGHHGHRGRRPAGRGQRRARPCSRTRARPRSPCSRNDTDVDGGPKAHRLGDPAGERHGRDHRRRHRPDLPAGRGLLQRPARHDRGHVHLHADARRRRRRRSR